MSDQIDDTPWVKTDYFCPSCGQAQVWRENDGGDYYVGETHHCVGCDSRFYLPDKPTKFQEYYFSGGEPDFGTKSYLKLMKIIQTTNQP